MDEQAQAWIAANTRDALNPPGSLDVRRSIAALKGTTRISVVIPARNEEDTLGRIVAAMRHDLMLESAIIDELLVIDSDSTDGTAAIARGAGASVHSAADIRPDLGWFPGKGEAMWKSLFVATGDIIVFIDGDLTTFSTDYVPALVMPLLHDARLQLVKGCYQRDLTAPGLDVLGTRQGGRVTELMARPLINVWWPALAGVIQPLAGEWAARRDLLGSLAIPCGYGVELAVLVDTFTRFGLDSIGQVDLGVRDHTHQDLASLGTMAAEILAAATTRRFPDANALGTTITQVQRELDGYAIIDRQINAQERPPRQAVATGPSRVSREAGQ